MSFSSRTPASDANVQAAACAVVPRCAPAGRVGNARPGGGGEQPRCPARLRHELEGKAGARRGGEGREPRPVRLGWASEADDNCEHPRPTTPGSRTPGRARPRLTSTWWPPGPEGCPRRWSPIPMLAPAARSGTRACSRSPFRPAMLQPHLRRRAVVPSVHDGRRTGAGQGAAEPAVWKGRIATRMGVHRDLLCLLHHAARRQP